MLDASSKICLGEGKTWCGGGGVFLLLPILSFLGHSVLNNFQGDDWLSRRVCEAGKSSPFLGLYFQASRLSYYQVRDLPLLLLFGGWCVDFFSLVDATHLLSVIT